VGLVMDDRVALIDAESGRTVTYGDIAALSDQLTTVAAGRRFAVVFTELTTRSLALYRAAYSADIAVALLEASLSDDLALPLLASYEPDVIIATRARTLPPGYREVIPDVYVRDGDPTPVDDDLAVLLSTSGSTGSPRFVRLSRSNIESNTSAIVRSLSLTADDRAMTMLPLSYSYGMSVVNTHLAVGGSVVVSSASLFEPSFWPTVSDHGVTMLNGVPSTFPMLLRIGLEKQSLPRLRALTQAGGRLAVDLVDRFADIMDRRGGEMFVMYGQTEASPRIASRSVTRSQERVGSCGVALTDGHLQVVDSDEVLPVGQTGEVVYRGPNVMLGYAEARADLVAGDVTGGVLHTGDLGRLDADGFLYLTGRTKRIAKISGLRISLDEIEHLVVGQGSVAAVPAGDDGIVVYCTDGDPTAFRSIERSLSSNLRLPPRSIRIVRADDLPLLPSGKVHYQALIATLKEEL